MLPRVLLSARQRPAPLRGLLRSVNHQPIVIACRRFGSASRSANAPSKWPIMLLTTGGVVGFSAYLSREPPELKEHNRQLLLARESIKQGQLEEAARYITRSFEAVENLMNPITKVLHATACALLWERLNKHETALHYYLTALKSLKAVNPISIRCVEGIRVMDLTALCYQHVGRYDTAEKLFKQAIRLYEKYHDELLSGSNKRVVNNLDSTILQVHLHYAQFLVSMKRESEVSLQHQRFVDVVTASPKLRARKRDLLDQFDDMMVLHSIREKRRRGREGSDERNEVDPVDV